MGMENQLPHKKLIDEKGILTRPEVLRREQREAGTNEAVAGDGKGEVLDRSKINEARKTRLEGEVAKTGEKPKEDVLDRAKMLEQRKVAEGARAQELKKTIEERLTAVEEQVGLDGEKPFSKEGLLNRNLGK
jgi:hypothetical protein